MLFFNKLFSKSAKITTNTNDQFSGYDTGNKKNELTPSELVKLNNGWAGICNNKNAKTLSSISLKLYYHNKSGKNLKLSPFKRLSNAKSKKICKNLNIKLKGDAVIDEIIDHPILDLLDKVNEKQNKNDLIELISQYLGCIGNSYVRIIKGDDGLPESLDVLLGEYINIKATGSNDGTIVAYEYCVPKQPKIRLKPEEVIHFLNYVPGNNLAGKGELEFCLSAVDRMNSYDMFEAYLLKNMSRPDFIAAFKKPINDAAKMDLYKMFKRKFGGLKNTGEPIIMDDADFDIKTLGFNPRDMQYQVGRSWSLKEICAAFGIPEALVSIQDVNKASSLTAMNYYLKTTIFPKMSNICQKLNEQLMPMYGQEGLYIWFNEDLDSNPSDIITAYTSGITTLNEARSCLGHENIEGGDELKATNKEIII